MAKILIIEDDNANLEMFTSFVKTMGHDVLSARHAQEGIEIAREEAPDIILIDFYLPGTIDGIQAIHLMKNDQKLATIPMIIITAHDSPRDRQRAFAAGAEGFLVKPVRIMELKELVNSFILHD